MATQPQFSILIPAYNEERFIAATVESVRRSFAEVACDSYEIVVCDNNSTDRTAEIARSAGARVVFEPHNQISRARNTAAKTARGEWFIFLDADTLLNAATLRAMMAAVESGRAGAGGATVRLDSDLGRLAEGLINTWNAISRTLKLAAGSFVFCRRDAWLATGGFDERIYVSEEIWFSRKLKRWCRANGLKFTILADTPIVTSARKLRWYSAWELLGQFIIFLIPGTWRRRERCAQWYTRPMPERGK